MNKMAEVAALFGKKLRQEFVVRIKYKGKVLCKFGSKCLYYHEPLVGDWLPASGEMLLDLLTGEATIIDG